MAGNVKDTGMSFVGIWTGGDWTKAKTRLRDYKALGAPERSDIPKKLSNKNRRPPKPTLPRVKFIEGDKD
jgi:hypothetical protein